MGAIIFRGREFVTALSEAVGYKSGIALGEERLRALVFEAGYEEHWPQTDDGWTRVRSEEFEDLFAALLGRLGAAPPLRVAVPIADVFHRHKHDPESRAVFDAVAGKFVEHLQEVAAGPAPLGGKIDPTPFIAAAEAQHGEIGRQIAAELVLSAHAHLMQSPWNQLRRVEWADIRELDELFAHERLETAHGRYFDQRFVDFLAANFDDIDEINWRQFEGLAAEFFARFGFVVQLGPGRADGGVDLRLWSDEAAAAALPATVLVQCKRQRRRISNTVVKALWADVVEEQADSGLIVTTSSFSPSAREVRTARGYPVGEADRATLRRWIAAMRSPGSGVFLGE